MVRNADQGFATPVARDEAEQAVFDLVPFAGTRGEVTHGHLQPRDIGEVLQTDLPEACAGAVAAARIRRDQE